MENSIIIYSPWVYERNSTQLTTWKKKVEMLVGHEVGVQSVETKDSLKRYMVIIEKQSPEHCDGEREKLNDGPTLIPVSDDEL